MADNTIVYNHDGLELPVSDWMHDSHSFLELTRVIQSTHDAAQTCAVKAINRMQTMRNWLIGYYIVEFEQHGKDRAEYGDHLLKRLVEKVNRKGLNVTLFQNSRNFYLYYPQMMENLWVRKSSDQIMPFASIYPTLSDKSMFGSFVEKSPTVSDKFRTSGRLLISRLSFSHIVEIMTQSDPLARYFYEQECIKCTWSVRELRRQISTNLYVRAGISTNPEKMMSLPTMKGHDSNALQIREPFTFEFLGLKAQEVVTEYDIEEALISHLQEFLLELGKGFCFESRQKRIVIDDEYYYPDLVFYMRLPVWTINCLFLPICSNCQIRRLWKIS